MTLSQKIRIDMIMDSIIELLEEESKYLSSNKYYDIFSSNIRKTRLLYDFNSMLKSEISSEMKSKIKEKLLILQRSAMQNAAVCRFHVDALREIMSVVIYNINDANSDKTYRNYRK